MRVIDSLILIRYSCELSKFKKVKNTFIKWSIAFVLYYKIYTGPNYIIIDIFFSYLTHNSFVKGNIL